ncbi:MAG: S8 family serine peptidase [Bacteroidales bacterium]
MRKYLLLLTALLFVTLTQGIAQERQVNPDGKYKGIIRVKFQPQMAAQLEALHAKPGNTQNQVATEEAHLKTGIAGMDQLNATYSAAEMKRVFRYSGKFEQRHREAGLHLWYEVRFNPEHKPTKVVASYDQLDEVLVAEPVYERGLIEHEKAEAASLSATANDPNYSSQWHYNNTGQSGGTVDADIDLPEAWDLETGDTQVVVAIEDEGVDFDHVDLAGNMWTNTGEVPGNGVDDDNNGYVDDYYGYNFGYDQGAIVPGEHGTHVGGTVAAETNNGVGVAGVAGGSGNNDGVRLMSVQVFSGSSQGGFAEGFVYAADMGAHISQNSWGGGGESQSVNDAIDYFVQNGGSSNVMSGGVVVIAAGNSNVSSGASTWPAQYENAIAVASTDDNDVRSSFSNYGSWVDIAAPGSDILSCKPNDSYQYMSGTSMACPHVSGVAALIVSHFKGNITPAQVRARLEDSADNIDGKNPNYIGQLGSGRLNAYSALSGETPPDPPATYCTSQGSNFSYEWIAEVQVGTYSNTSGAAGYSDFTNEEIAVEAGESYAVSLTPEFSGSSYNEYWKIWIDFNNDTIFDASELVFDAGSLSKSTVTGSIAIPADATGTRRMRVSMKYNGAQTACETFSYGEVEDYHVVIGSATPDTEAPTAPSGLAATNVTETSVDLSWNASTDNVGVDSYWVYQNGSQIATTASTSYGVTGLSPATSYNFTVKAVDAAGNVSAASNQISVTTDDSSPVEYCASKGNNTNYEWIDLVELGSINNTTGANGGYADFTNLSTNLTRGDDATIYISAGFSSSSYTEYWHVWIDLDQSGTFESDELLVSGSSSSADRLQATLTIPSDAVLGATRMRVTMKYNAAAQPCETFSYGEVEDYTVNITDTYQYQLTQHPNAKTLEDKVVENLKIYPNPAQNYLQLELNHGAGASTMVTIYNSEGKQMKHLQMEGETTTIDVSDLPAGNYILKVDDEKEPFVKEFIKQ